MDNLTFTTATVTEPFRHKLLPYPILMDSYLNDVLWHEGYVVVDWFNPAELAQLRTYVNNLKLKDFVLPKFHASCGDPDLDHRMRMGMTFHPFQSRNLERLFLGYEIFISALISREPSPETELDPNLPGIHHDRSLVDESKYRSIAIWAPLCDTNRKNGGFSVIPGSHKFGYEIRTTHLPNHYDHLRDELLEYLIEIPITAGKAILFDTALLHHTGLNYSNERRDAILSYARPIGAQTYYYYEADITNRPDGYATVERWEVDDQFSFEHVYGIRPTQGKLLETFPYKVHKWTLQEIGQFLAEQGNPLAKPVV